MRNESARTLWWWGGLLAGGWVALGLLLLVPILWTTPTYLATDLPTLYRPLVGALPGRWVGAAPDDIPVRALAFALYCLLQIGLWGAFAGALRAAYRWRGPASARMVAGILAGGFALGLLTIGWPGLFSADVFAYMGYGKMQVVYGLNPFATTSGAMTGDPWLAWLPWQQEPNTYGPITSAAEALVAAIAQALGGARVVYLLCFRALNLGLIATAAALIWACGGLLGWPSGRRIAATILMAWCPLTILELVANAHNDGLLVVLVLLAVWLHLRGFWPLAVAALALAGMAKLPGFYFLPAYTVLLVRGATTGRARRCAAVVGIATLTAGLVSLPYAGAGLLALGGLQRQAGWFGGSLGDALWWILAERGATWGGIGALAGLPLRQAQEVLRWPLYDALIGTWLLLALLLSLPARDFATLLRAWWAVILTNLLLAVTKFEPWYVIWLLPVLALLPDGRRRRLGLVLAGTSSLNYALSPMLPGNPATALWHFTLPAIVFSPVLAYAAWAGRHRIARALRTGQRPAPAGRADG